MSAMSTFLRHTGLNKHTASGAVTAGDLLLLADGRAAQAVTDIADTKDGQIRTLGQIAAASASGTTFSKGDPVFWDISAGLAVAYGSADVPNGDYLVGTAVKAKVSGDLVVEVDLNVKPESAAAAQKAVATTGATNSSPYGFTTAAQADDMVATINAMRLAMIKAGIMKGAA